jgi:hypothetical protein
VQLAALAAEEGGHIGSRLALYRELVPHIERLEVDLAG